MEIRNFTYNLPNHQNLFNDLSAIFSDNKLNVLLGPNGEGKTTLLDFIAETNKRPSKNFIDFPDHSKIAYQMQGVPFISEATVFSTIKMIMDIENPKNNFSVNDLPNELKDIANNQFKYLSGGQRRIVIIDSICRLNRELYLFDEPESGLDPKMAQKVIQRINQLSQTGKKVIITSHQFQNLENKNFNLLFIKEGKIRFVGSSKEFLNNNKANNLLDAYIQEDNSYK